VIRKNLDALTKAKGFKVIGFDDLFENVEAFNSLCYALQ